MTKEKKGLATRDYLAKAIEIAQSVETAEKNTLKSGLGEAIYYWSGQFSFTS